MKNTQNLSYRQVLERRTRELLLESLEYDKYEELEQSLWLRTLHTLSDRHLARLYDIILYYNIQMRTFLEEQEVPVS